MPPPPSNDHEFLKTNPICVDCNAAMKVIPVLGTPGNVFLIYRVHKNNYVKVYTVFDLITAPALITAAPPPDFLLYFHLLSPT